MQREIKFRALNAQGMFEYGALIQRNFDGNERLYIYDTRSDETEINEYFGDGKWDLKDCFTPVQIGTEGQYTGLKDKNGVEIYEGDIVRYYDQYLDDDLDKGIATVQWEVNGFEVGFKLQDIKTFQYCRFSGGINSIHHIEVIGNIYENPDLTAPSKAIGDV